MWWRSASFILDQQQQHHLALDDAVSKPDTRIPSSSTSMSETLQNPNNHISAYYQTRAAHHGVVSSDWLAQAQAAVGAETEEVSSEKSLSDSGKPFSVIDEFNNWRKQPDLAEAVAAIRALASVISSSHATTMMELEIELNKASDSLKVIHLIIIFFCFLYLLVCYKL